MLEKNNPEPIYIYKYIYIYTHVKKNIQVYNIELMFIIICN